MNRRRRATKLENLFLELMRFLFARLVSRHSPEELCTCEAPKPQARNGYRNNRCKQSYRAKLRLLLLYTLPTGWHNRRHNTLCETLIAP